MPKRTINKRCPVCNSKLELNNNTMYFECKKCALDKALEKVWSKVK